MSDYYRPSADQVEDIYRCTACHREHVVASIYAAPTRCDCGGHVEHVGEQYPADVEDWREERGRDGEWRERW